MLNNFIFHVLTSAGVSAALLAGLVWLLKSWIGERLKGAIRFDNSKDLAEFKDQLKKVSDFELMNLRSKLAKLETEHAVVFTRFHEKRAEITSELYARITDLRDETNRYRIEKFIRRVDNPELKDDWSVTVDEFQTVFRRNRIFFREDTCRRIQSIDEMITKVVGSVDYSVWEAKIAAEANPRRTGEELKKEHMDQWEKVWVEVVEKKLKEELPEVLEEIEVEFRSFVGLFDAQPSSTDALSSQRISS